ncbi:iron-containing alcohol dehydrogenase [Streptomyces sp. NPDC052494]|uniref:3-dehydroquinate synthase family protein n=1 Tax=Streptomyces sp. NPDC052494 TaxID=3365692 RepID=UPI0037D55303
MSTTEHAHVRFTARQDLTWYASIKRGLLDSEPKDAPLLFGPRDRSRRRLVVLDETVHDHYGERILALLARYGITHPDPLTIPGGEATKTNATVERVHAAMESWGVPRFDEPLLVWGGGVAHDVAGFAAATYRRNVPYIMVGTTLVAAIDAMYALKVATNAHYKNRIGAYHPPVIAYADPAFFATLTDDQILDGVGEIFKVAVALDGRLFGLLEAHGARAISEKFQGQDRETLAILRRSLAAMAPELSDNPYEHNPARKSYAGHSISPAMEPDITHGTAVVLDLLVTTVLAWQRGHVTTGYRDRIVALAAALGLPVWHSVLECPASLWAALVDTTRHRGGRQLVPAPGGQPGTVQYLNSITEAELSGALDHLRSVADAARPTAQR